ncbi:MAG: FKBP-type peptidyl-prolyl cis-trans isomerase [Bacteroidota bacterium]
MNSRQIITLIVVTVAALVAGYFIGASRDGIKSEDQVSMNNQSDSLNYFLGLNMGYGMAQLPWEADADLIVSGFFQVMKDSSAFDQMTVNTMLQELDNARQAEASKSAESAAMDNLENGIAFLEENGKKEGITSTESGLQYEVLTEGTGPKPSDTSTVTVFYEGSLIDGTIFESSFETNDSVTFPLNGVIPGWTEGVQLMSLGSTYRFYIPSNLAYGPRDTGPIPGNSVLIFRIELLGIE